MWNKLFEHLRRRMTCIYAAIFGVLILLLVFGAYIFIWWEIVDHEKHELVEKVYHEAEEWVDSGEEPCSAVSIQEGSMLAYFVTMDDKMVILNQLGDGPQGRALWRHREDWPQKMDSTRILRMHGDATQPDGTRYRYLAAVAPVVKNGETVGKLYMFENIEFYYGGRCAVITVTRDMIKETGCPLGDLDGVTAMSRQIEGVQIGVTIKEKPDGKYKVSLRTFEPYNAADICAVFGGGGHIRAAGCEFSCDIESAKRQLLSAIGEVLR